MEKKLRTLKEVVGMCSSGASIALGGATMRRKPMTLVRALADSDLENLDLWTWLGSLDVDLLIAAGKVRSVNSAYVGFGAFGLAQTARRSYADDSVEFIDWSEGSLAASFRAGAAGLPYALSKALLGTDLTPGLALKMDHPPQSEPVAAVPAAHPDIALIHAQSADQLGNVRRRSPHYSDDIDNLIAASAEKVIVSVEELEDPDDVIENRDETLIPGHWVSAVVHAPNGAFPTGCDGYYDPDFTHFRHYAQASASRQMIAEYIDRFVAGVDPAAFADLVAEELAA